MVQHDRSANLGCSTWRQNSPESPAVAASCCKPNTSTTETSAACLKGATLLLGGGQPSHLQARAPSGPNVRTSVPPASARIPPPLDYCTVSPIRTLQNLPSGNGPPRVPPKLTILQRSSLNFRMSCLPPLSVTRPSTTNMQAMHVYREIALNIFTYALKIKY